MCLEKFRKKLKVIDVNEIYIKNLREIEEEEIGRTISDGAISDGVVTHLVCEGETSVELIEEMRPMFESYAGKELSIHELFAMEAIFEMLQREEISEEDTEIKLEKLLTEKNKKRN